MEENSVYSDLMPSDILGTKIWKGTSLGFELEKGPIFTNFLLADEINRAMPKSQSALLEAMEERQVSIEGTTHVLKPPFIVMATQNPIENGEDLSTARSSNGQIYDEAVLRIFKK